MGNTTRSNLSSGGGVTGRAGNLSSSARDAKKTSKRIRKAKSLKRIDMNGTDNSGCTPLHMAAFHGRADMISFLLDADYGGTTVDTTLRNNLGYTACEWAQKWQQWAVVDVFEKAQTGLSVKTMEQTRLRARQTTPPSAILAKLKTPSGCGLQEEAVGDRDIDRDGTCDSVFLGPDRWQMLKAE